MIAIIESKKKSYVSGSLQSTTYYVRDVTGTAISIYSELPNTSITLTEQPIYGRRTFSNLL